MPADVVLLGQVAARLPVLEVGCDRCDWPILGATLAAKAVEPTRPFPSADLSRPRP
jgi:hypothetical protein